MINRTLNNIHSFKTSQIFLNNAIDSVQQFEHNPFRRTCFMEPPRLHSAPGAGINSNLSPKRLQ
jgi:hypothetical protein